MDGSGELEFPEFIQLAAKFLIEEDEEQMRWELREAFRLYDKHGTEGFELIFLVSFTELNQLML
jgi:Ca2+-binding EF-hand superfamily protein